MLSLVWQESLKRHKGRLGTEWARISKIVGYVRNTAHWKAGGCNCLIELLLCWLSGEVESQMCYGCPLQKSCAVLS